MTTHPLDGKTILVTGGTFGIGEALVRHLMQYKVRLIVVARTSEKLDALKKESASSAAEVTTYKCDLGNEESVNELCASLKETHIDYFVSNAGKSLMRGLDESSFRDYKKTIALNYLAPVQIILALMNTLHQSKTHIVNISTYNVLFKTPPKWTAYVSSKKAMHSWIEGNHVELQAKNITVSNIYLPLVESRMKDANPGYKNIRGMSMSGAVTAIMHGMLYRRNYRPWWHIPFQFLMFFLSPFWDLISARLIHKKKY